MARIEDHDKLQRLSFLYLALAQLSDDYLSNAGLESVTRMLTARSAEQDRDKMQALVMDTLDAYLNSADVESAMQNAAEHLRDVLSTAEKNDVLEDLQSIAKADGILLSDEQDVLDRLGRALGLDRSATPARETGGAGWGVLHDLAYIYLVLAHGTDNDLTDTEVQVMLNKLQEWQPADASAGMRSVLASAMDVYALGEDEERLERAIQSVRDGLPREKRMAAMNDLVKIANADGVFLDNEEDLINHLLAEWDVDPFANYGSHGSKE